VVGGAFEGDVVVEEALEGIGECGAGGIEDRQVIEAGGSGRGRGAGLAFPGVEADVVVVTAGGDEGGLVAVALGELEAEDVDVEVESAFEVGDFEVDVADASVGVDGGRGGHMDLIERGQKKSKIKSRIKIRKRIKRKSKSKSRNTQRIRGSLRLCFRNGPYPASIRGHENRDMGNDNGGSDGGLGLRADGGVSGSGQACR